MGGSGLAGIRCSGSGSSDDLHISDPFRMASNSGHDLAPSKNSQEKYFDGFSKSCNSFAIDSTM